MKSIRLALPLTVFTNTFYQVVGKSIVAFFGILTTILLTRYLGVLGFGQFNIILAYFAFAGTFADFGLGLLLTRELAKGKTEVNLINAIFTLRTIISFLILLVFVLISFFLPYPQIVKQGIIVYSFGNFFLLIYNLYYSVFQAKLRLEKHLVAQSLGSLLVLLLTFLFITLKFSFVWFVFAQTTGYIAMFLIGLGLLDKGLKLSINFNLFLKIIKNAWPLSLTGIIAIFYSRADIIILSFFKNPNIAPDVGIYSAAYRIFEVLVIFGTFFTNALFPVFVRRIKTPEFSSLFKESLLISFLAAILLTLLLIFLAKYMILIIAGEKFMEAILPLQILGFALALSLFLNIYYSLIIALNRQKQTILVGLVALAFNFISNVIFIPKFSYLASSILTVITTVIILVGYILIVKTKEVSRETI